MAIFLPEYTSDKVVRIAFSNFGEVLSVFNGRHKFNRIIRNGKRHGIICPAEGNAMMLPIKIAFNDYYYNLLHVD